MKPVWFRLSVNEDGLPVPLQGYATEPCHQWMLPRTSLLDSLKASPFALFGLYDALVASEQFPAWGLVLVDEGLDKRFPHDPVQPPEVGDILGQ